MLSYSTLNFKREIDSDYLGERIYNLLDDTFSIPDNYIYNVFTVTEEYIARPDLISLDAYGDTMFGDVICKLNGVSNPFEFNVGMKLIIPSPENIMDFTSRTMDDWDATVTEYTSSTKTKQSPRQANEAILGDSRFKIDTTAGIIIY